LLIQIYYIKIIQNNMPKRNNPYVIDNMPNKKEKLIIKIVSDVNNNFYNKIEKSNKDNYFQCQKPFYNPFYY